MSFAALAPMGAAQDSTTTDRYPVLRSMGEPKTFRPYGGAMFGIQRVAESQQFAGRALAGVGTDFRKPVIGILGVAAEGYLGSVGGTFDGGARLLATSRIFRLAAGIDYSVVSGRANFLVALTDPIWRGGIFQRGGQLRFEWLPARHSMSLGLTFPLFQPWVAKTRPRTTEYKLPPAPEPAPLTPHVVAGAHLPAGAIELPVRTASLTGFPPPELIFGISPPTRVTALDAALRSSLAELRRSARLIDALTTPAVDAITLDKWQEQVRAAAESLAVDGDSSGGHGARTMTAEVARYHRAMAHAFAQALGADSVESSTDDPVPTAARRILLDQVVIPYNKYFARIRKQSVLAELCRRAAVEFARWADTSADVPLARRARVVAVFDTVLASVRDGGQAAYHRWGDTRYVWLPFQLALRDEDHDTQTQIDALVERVSGASLVRNNQITYLTNEQFNPELRRTIHAAEDYHVLWVHDFPGLNEAGDPDAVSHEGVLAYLGALAARAREFDSTGKIPVFILCLDEWYYDDRDTHMWMALLQDPLRYELRLPPNARDMEDAVRSAQEELRAAVAGSARLTALADERGQDWLSNLLSVHVSITHPGDPSYAGRFFAGDLTLFFSDDWMRDHRKIVLYDATERDPGRGGALFTGEGVGSLYEQSGWEDRSLFVRGPAVVRLKASVRELLTSQGFRLSEIPRQLRAEPLAPDYDARVTELAREGWSGNLLVAENGVGYADKHASAVKAALYNLMPQGCRILAADPQWSAFYWASMLVGSALRGCQVLAMAPSPANMPVENMSWMPLALEYEVFASLLRLQDILRAPINAVGGQVRTGLYTANVATGDFAARMRETGEALRRNSFIRDVLPFPKSVYDVLENPDSVLDRLDVPAPLRDAAPDTLHPKLHLKSQFFSTAEALQEILEQPAWDRIVYDYLRSRAEQSARSARGSAGGAIAPELLAPLWGELDGLPAHSRSRQIVYLTGGSINMDDRSLAQNGEVITVVAGDAGVCGLLDFLFLAGSMTWVNSVDELEQVLPRPSAGRRRFSRWVHRLI